MQNVRGAACGHRVPTRMPRTRSSRQKIRFAPAPHRVQPTRGSSVPVRRRVARLERRALQAEQIAKTTRAACKPVCRCIRKNDIEIAISNGHVNCLKALVDGGQQITDRMLPHAVYIGNPKVVSFLVNAECGGRRGAQIAAAALGDIDCLEYLYQHGSRWNGDELLIAAQYGRLDTLKYLRGSGSPWHKEAGLRAAYRGRLKCLKYLCINSAPLTGQELQAALDAARYDCAEWLLSVNQGFEFEK